MTPLCIVLKVVGCVAAAGLIVWFVRFSNNALTVERQKIVSEKAPSSPVTIVHLSDLHGKSFGRDNRKLVAKIQSLHADAVVITGDVIHRYSAEQERTAVALVRKLAQNTPVLYVSGNHEMRGKRYRALRDALIGAGAQVLDNRTVEMFGMTVTGLNCAHLKNDTAFRICPKDDGRLRLLLAHEPQYIARYAMAGYDLALCGHAHGGQWRVPFTSLSVYAPGQGLFPKLTSGQHRCGGLRMIVSRGLGNSQCPLRLFNRPQIVVVTVAREDGGGQSEKS